MEKEETRKKFSVLWIVLIAAIVLAILTFTIAPIYISLALFAIIYLPVILYILIYKWLGRWFASAVFTFSVWLNILLIVIPIFGGLLILDVSKFSQEFLEQPKYIAIDDNGIKFAVKQAPGSQEISFITLSQTEINSLQQEIDKNNVQNKVVLLIKKDVFRIVQNIGAQGISLSKDDAISLLESEDPAEFLGISELEELGSPEEIKLAVFFLLMEETVKTGGEDYIIEELKARNIIIYPDRWSVRILVNILPTDILTGLLPSLTGGTGPIAEGEDLSGIIGGSSGKAQPKEGTLRASSR